VPAWLGVPVNAPVEEFNDNPAGRDDPAATDQLYGVLPPVADTVAEYAVPTCPLGNTAVVIDIIEVADTVKLSAFVAVCTVVVPSLTCTVKENVPDCAGVPLNWPEAFRLSPEGREEPAARDQVYGAAPPVAVKVAAYAVPAWAFGREALVIDRGEGVPELVELDATSPAQPASPRTLIEVTIIVRSAVPKLPTFRGPFCTNPQESILHPPPRFSALEDGETIGPGDRFWAFVRAGHRLYQWPVL